MAGYSPLKITGMTTGLVQQREEFLLPNDAYPVLENSYVWRERILRKKGYQLLGRLQRNLTNQSLGNTITTGIQFNIFDQIDITGTVTGVTQANPGEVTTGANHLLQTGQIVKFAAVGGMVELNGNSYTITVTAANKFTIGVDTTAYTMYTAGGTWEVNNTSLEPNKSVVPGTVVITMPGPIVFRDQGNGTLTSTTPGNSGVIDYTTGDITLTTTAGAGNSKVTFSYYPGLPVMGIRIQELVDSANDQTVFFDQVYAYVYDITNNIFKEFIPGTTWNMHAGSVSASDFFYSTNYWISDGGAATPFATLDNKLFWVTNNTGQFGVNEDPPRITDGLTWVNFFPSSWSQTGVDAGSNPLYLANFLSMLPYRGRLVVFNTWEGRSASQLQNFRNRVRWSTIGNPFIAFASGPPATGSWRDDVRGQGGFLDVPTSEDIICVGFVRDNLVIYCERSTWQLRYTGRSIAPFQIERVNSELGAESPFSAVQFDTSLVGIGDKGVVECDSYKSQRIDIKIPDLVFDFNSLNNGVFRVHGVRDFINRLAYWTFPYSPGYDPATSGANQIFPNRRLLYNYENDSWAIFTDSLTTLGTYQAQTSRRWIDVHLPWKKCFFSWISGTQSDPLIVGGNQDGFIEILDQTTTNDPSLYITAITGFATEGTATIITSPNHNLTSDDVISISGIPLGTDFENLNYPQQGLISGATQANPCVITSTDHRLTTGASIIITDVVGMVELNDTQYTITYIDANTFSLDGTDSTAFTPYVSGGTWTNQGINVFGIEVIDQDNFALYVYSNETSGFDDPQEDPDSYVYIGGGEVSVRDNFSIKSKKFNFLDYGQNIQLGYIDILLEASEAENPGAITLYVYLDYDDVNPSNTAPQNDINDGTILLNPDTFFNSNIPTTQSTLSGIGGTKFWQRVYCATRANFLTLEYTLSNLQMSGTEQEQDVQIDAQVLWIRKAGRMTSI